jgi:hypothetical protein
MATFILLTRFGFWSLVSWVVLRWKSLPAAIQIWTSKILFAIGLACFAAAPFAKGSYSAQVILHIGGPNPHQVENIQRTYMLLGFGVGLALLGMAALAHWGDRLPWKSPVGQAVKLTVVLILLRAYCEKLGVPQSLAMFIGIIWLILPLAVYFGNEAAKTASQATFWRWLVGYTFTIRIFVLVIMVLATHFHWGTHFDNSSVTSYRLGGTIYHVESNSWEQYGNLIIFPQLVLWPLVTLAAGVVFGLPAYLLARSSAFRRKKDKLKLAKDT